MKIFLSVLVFFAITACSSTEPNLDGGSMGYGEVFPGIVIEAGPSDSAEPVITISNPGEINALIVHDIKVGDGDEIFGYGNVNAHYVGVGVNSGMTFDSSFTRGAPITFPLDKVIAGWTEGLQGMQVGGRRALVIPADMAYGSNPPPGSIIEEGESLIFVVDLIGLP